MPIPAARPAAPSPAVIPAPGAAPSGTGSPAAAPQAAGPPAAGPGAVRPLAPVSAAGDSAAPGESDADRALTAMYGTQYRSMVRLAVLLTGDLGLAEEVAQESFAAMHQAWGKLRRPDAALSFLRRAVVARSRSAAPDPPLAVAPRYEPPAGEGGRPLLRAVPPGAAGPAAAADGTGQAGVITALQRLPAMQREALALRLYLDLPDGQIADAMRVSRAAVRGHLASGLAALRGVA
jgi:DNA-directed RNA polymerase specialized sigma24 family protein